MENWKEEAPLKKAGFPYFASSKYDCRKMGRCREIETFGICLLKVQKMHHIVSVIRRAVCIRPAQEDGESIWALFDKGIYSKKIPWHCLTQTASRIPAYLKSTPCLGVMEWNYFYTLLLYAQLPFTFMLHEAVMHGLGSRAVAPCWSVCSWLWQLVCEPCAIGLSLASSALAGCGDGEWTGLLRMLLHISLCVKGLPQFKQSMGW